MRHSPRRMAAPTGGRPNLRPSENSLNLYSLSHLSTSLHIKTIPFGSNDIYHDHWCAGAYRLLASTFRRFAGFDIFPQCFCFGSQR